MSSLAAQKLMFQVVFSSLVVVAGLTVTWLLLADSSPFHEYFLWHTGIQDVWQITVIVPYIVSAMIEGNPHSPSMVIFILVLIFQWIVVAWVLSIPVAKLWLRLQRK